MLNFDNSIARERLARNYAGVVDFGMGDFHSTSYLYSPKDYTIGGDTDYGGLKVFDSDKYIIKTPKFKSAYHMAEFVTSPLPDIPSTEKSQFNGADMNQFLSVPKDDLVLENYVGQEAQAEGLKSEEEFFVSQARKEATDSNLTDLDRFMRSSEIDDLITYKPSLAKNQPLGKTDSDRQEIPDVRLTGLTTKPAFDVGGGLLRDGTSYLEQIDIKNVKRIQHKFQAFKTTRIMKKHDAMMEKHNKAKETEKENEKIQSQNRLEQLQVDQARTKKQLERIEKKNVGKKSEKKESKSEEEKESKSGEEKESKSGKGESKEESGKGTFELGSEFASSEKNKLEQIISNLGFSMSLNTKELKSKLNLFLKQEYGEGIKGNFTNTNWFKRFLSIVEKDDLKYSTPHTTKKSRKTPNSKSSREISAGHDFIDAQLLRSLTNERNSGTGRTLKPLGGQV